MKWSEYSRNAANHLWEASLSHPFVREIADGTLPIEAFAHYIRNDALYLRTFAQVQRMGAAKADAQLGARLRAHAANTDDAERALHQTFFSMLDIAPPDAQALPAPTAYRYMSHLITVASLGTVAEVVAAILPCYWLYWEIGLHYRDARPEHPVYQRWVATYGSAWYGELVREQLERADNLAAAASIEEQQKMTRHFLLSSQYELEFWTMAYDLETWRFEECETQ
ncbi:thiaminase II [Alicyclobacillus fodiniaquatilis]|jgi:thiaminase/transcriptional activator TenA|uniref:Aminopyrimidine aminohydrolase n=1 Tax=Alicyclobacillus fodiniaquatilis TaxID=1661150 RepID=A0ABW4JKW4_9BACL